MKYKIENKNILITGGADGLGKNLINFPIPEGIKFEKVDVHTGTLADNKSKETMNVAVKEETVILPRANESIPIDKEPVELSKTSELTNVPNP